MKGWYRRAALPVFSFQVGHRAIPERLKKWKATLTIGDTIADRTAGDLSEAGRQLRRYPPMP